MSVMSTKIQSGRDTVGSRINTTYSNMNKLDPTQNQDEEQNQQSQTAVRNILGFMDKYDRVDQQELLAQMTCHWLLSMEDFKIPIESPPGIISQMQQLHEDHMLILIPYDSSIPAPDYREIHQLIRELTVGMYVCNQHPSLHFESNYDQSTSCQLPPAYIDSKLGQVMITTDYWLKALWHGSFFEKTKRVQFVQKYMSALDVDSNGNSQSKKSVLKEFLSAGLSDIAKDPEYSEIFKTEDKGENGNLSFQGVGMTAEFQKSTITMIHEAFSEQSNKTDSEIEDEIKNFLTFIEDISMTLTFGLSSVKRYKNMFEYNGDFDVNICCKADHLRIDDEKFERIKPILTSHENYVRNNLTRKTEVRHNMTLLKFISFLVPTLIALKKKMKIPDVNNLLPIITGEEVSTERSLPPLMIGPGFKSKTFLHTVFEGNRNNMSASTDNHDNSEYSNIVANETNRNSYFNLHGGIQFELETCDIQEAGEYDEEFESCYEEIISQSAEILTAYLQAENLQEYRIPVVEKNNKKYWAVRIDIENYYAQFPQKPYWVCKLNDDLSKLRPKRMPMSDLQVYDLFKKHFGYRKATKLKTLQTGLKASSQRGFLNVFQSFARKTPLSNLARHDEFGLGLIHYAAIFNHPNIITNLVTLGVDSNLKQQISVKNYMQPIGPLGVHYASRCGSLDALSCLLSNYGNISFYDENGWLPIHHASYFDNVPVIRLLLRRQDELKESQTKIDTLSVVKKRETSAKKTEMSKKTPLLVAASAGSLEAIKCLIKHDVNISYHDEKGRSVIHIATHRTHTNILSFFIENGYHELKPWIVLIEMLDSSKDIDKDSSVKCLQLLTSQNKKYWSPILMNGGITKLCNILREFTSSFTVKKPPQVEMIETPGETVLKHHRYLNALSVLCNISDRVEIKQCLINEIKDFCDILINIIEFSNNEDMESRTAILIGDIASHNTDIKNVLAEKGALKKLIPLLNKDTEDLLVNTVNALEILCNQNIPNQDYCCENGVLENLVELLGLNSDFLKITVAAAISSMTHDNQKNQIKALELGVFEPLVELLEMLKNRNMTVKLKVAMALESLAINNQRTQEAITALGADIYMIKLCESMYYVGAMIKSNMEDWSIVVREQAAITLWTLAGMDKPQRKSIAEKIGISQIISMLMSKSEKLQYVGCKCMIALVLEDVNYQNQILKENGIDPLIRLLRTDTSNRVVLAIFETIGALCVDIAHVNNKLTQIELCEKGAIDIILNLLNDPPPKYKQSFIQIEISHALACLILNRGIESEIEDQINMKSILSLIKTGDMNLRLKAGLAITVLAYNNNDKQFDIKSCGGISYEWYAPFFDDAKVDIMNLCDACFQIIILARVINDRDQVWLTALGVSRLVQLLLLDNEQVVIQTASYMSSLAHTRCGITDAMITCDAVDILCDRLYSTNDQIRFASAVTLGYLTFNRTASRLLLHNCRNVPSLFNTLMSILKVESKISQQFVESYQMALELGLPKLLVKNKVKFFESTKPVEEPDFKGFYDRTKSAKLVKSGMLKPLNINDSRTQSAPAKAKTTSAYSKSSKE